MHNCYHCTQRFKLWNVLSSMCATGRLPLPVPRCPSDSFSTAEAHQRINLTEAPCDIFDATIVNTQPLVVTLAQSLRLSHSPSAPFEVSLSLLSESSHSSTALRLRRVASYSCADAKCFALTFSAFSRRSLLNFRWVLLFLECFRFSPSPP